MAARPIPYLPLSVASDNPPPQTPSSPPSSSPPPTKPAPSPAAISTKALQTLSLLALQNCAKNLLTRHALSADAPRFLYSAAVLGSELTKLSLSFLYIVLVDRQPPSSIVAFFRSSPRSTLLLAVPAATYNAQQTLEYVALSHLPAPTFAVCVQLKQFFTALFAVALLKRSLRLSQVLSLVLLTTGVMLCSMRADGSPPLDADAVTGLVATLLIALSSGFASVYTEKVIKSAPPRARHYSLAYMQVSTRSGRGGGSGGRPATLPPYPTEKNLLCARFARAPSNPSFPN